MVEISARTLNLGTENAFVVLKEVNELLGKGKDIVNFCIGQPDFDTPEYIKQATIEALKNGKTGYTASAGIPELRQAAATYLSETRNLKVSPESVVIANGAKPFIGYSILSTTDHGKGDEVLYPNPGFPIYESLIKEYGAVPVTLPLLEKKGYAFDIGYMEDKINQKTRLLILNSPHNPTGGVLSRKILEEISEVVQRFDDLWVFSDEPYSRMAPKDKFTSIASIPGMQERTIIVDGVSKTYAMTGWRIGYASNEKLAPHLSKWITNTDSCAGHPNQYAALAALTGPQEESYEMMESYTKRRDIIVEGLNRIPGVNCLMPGGAFYAWPNVTEACNLVGVPDSEEFRKLLLDEAGVAVLSDIHFGHKNPGEGEHIRFSFATSEENILEGLKRIRRFISENMV
ncbi:aspartate aminotransferase [Candidatus Bathyarchaeota archaeon]|jgi:aspartate/methionine/tyrosine aminotransferase|nr:aspartate aminotransferase [Candidatus Bathyarchaeota archaeon]MDP7443237.1 pyridoxal phosphate-dependent aminotransferase [Candidatus Bathyarchaeota archaeon]